MVFVSCNFAGSGSGTGAGFGTGAGTGTGTGTGTSFGVVFACEDIDYMFSFIIFCFFV